MTNFEKWNSVQSDKDFYDSDQIYANVVDERERAWKAALKWVTSLKGLREPAWVFDYIKEELENENL